MCIMKKEAIFSLIALLTIPFARADMCLPVLINISAINIILFIPIVLIESSIAYFMVRWFSNFRITFCWSLLAFVAANIVSSIAGIIFGIFYPVCTKYMQEYLWLIIPAYFITVFAELPIIYLLFRKKTDKCWRYSLILSLLVNISSYILIFFILLN